MKRHELLTEIHRVYRPRTYLEVGVNDGRSLALAKVKSIAVDPAFKVTSQISCDVRLVRATSDKYFARPKAVAFFPHSLIDLAFIDGMHLFEFALRDFVNIERFSRWSSVVVFDDMLPRNIDEAARDRHTGAWTGDVYKLAEVLRQHRPDLLPVVVDTQPTGQLMVFGADPNSRVLAKIYDSLIEEWVVPDPQNVPHEVLTRSQAVDPVAFLAAPFWRDLVVARHRRIGPRGSWSALRPKIEEAVRAARRPVSSAPTG
jgi:hypothetical protein